jgi:hypothetical protein
VAFSFPDARVSESALPFVRQKRPDIAVLARTKFRSEAERLASLGVQLVILDEEESGRASVRAALGVFDVGVRNGA